MTDNRATERVDHPPRVREAIDELMREKDATDNRTTELREKLTERDVEWWPMRNNGYYEDRDTEFVVNGKKHTAHEWGDGLAVYGLTPEQAIAATLGSGTLTAEQVRKAIFDGSAYASYDGAQYYANGISMQAIADELNAELGSGTCEIDSTFWHDHGGYDSDTYEFVLSCGHSIEWLDREPPNYCPNCGKAVKR